MVLVIRSSARSHCVPPQQYAIAFGDNTEPVRRSDQTEFVPGYVLSTALSTDRELHVEVTAWREMRADEAS
jgi:hypothetical protein